MKKLKISCFILLVVFSVFTYAQIAIKTKIAACASCHGQNGNSPVFVFPKIAGQNERYFIKQMIDYKNGDRENPIMQAIVKNLTDDDINTLATYYSQQKTSIGHTKTALVSLGQMIYGSGILEKGVPACAACHEPNGLGNAQAGFPKLSGQHAAYTVQQLKDFRLKNRDNDIHRMMEMISNRMNDEEINAVASYIEELH